MTTVHRVIDSRFEEGNSGLQRDRPTVVALKREKFTRVLNDKREEENEHV